MSYPIVELADVVVFLDHRRRPITANERVQGNTPYYGANGQQDSVDGFLFDEPLVLLAEDGGHFGEPEKGVAYSIEGKSWVNNHAHVLRPTSKIDAGFLTRVLENRDLRAFVSGSTRGKLTKASASKIPIPLPSLPEQCRIAAILDQADDLRTKRRRALTCLDELVDAVFSEFDDLAQSMRPAVSRDLSSITKGGRGIKAGPFGSSLRKADYSTQGYRVYGQEQVIAGDFSIGNYFVDEEKYRQLISNAVSPGDVLVSAVGTYGRIAIVPESASPGIINPRLLKISPDLEQVTPDYLAALLRSQRLQREIQRRSHGGTMGIINASLLKDLPVSVPSMELQSKWGQVQSGIEKQIMAGLAASTQTEELFASLQHRAFRGEL